jgi:hypothetical protein
MSKTRIWEDSLVGAALKHCVQIQENIEHLADTSETQPYEMPGSLVPTDVLYNLATCYQLLYGILLKQDLIETGNTKIPKNFH